tara:strand:- start:165 stop:356 length:192 start_codon:yes stop_codon:yes gene_type:complete
LFSSQRQITENKTIKKTIIPKAEYIENPSASKSEDPNIENLKALIIYKIGLPKEMVCQNCGSN